MASKRHLHVPLCLVCGLSSSELVDPELPVPVYQLPLESPLSSLDGSPLPLLDGSPLSGKDLSDGECGIFKDLVNAINLVYNPAEGQSAVWQHACVHA